VSAVQLEGIGLDIGSTSVKVVAARSGRIVYRDYRRHRGQCLPLARAMLADAQSAVGERAPRLVTGSAGAGFAEILEGTYVHEVHAVAAAVLARFPEARTIIELGGQDAKMIHIEPRTRTPGGEPSFASEMNERCAAGTGAVLDRCLYRLGVTEGDLARFRLPDQELPAVSAKCGVFAETDLVNLVTAGVPIERAIAALLDAVVRGNLAVLARGRALPPPVVLLGGPHAFIPALAAMWERHLRARWLERAVAATGERAVIVPTDAATVAAEGTLRAAPAVRASAARAGRGARVGARRRSLISACPNALEVRPGLVEDGVDVQRELGRLIIPAPRATGRCTSLALGIDAGSTTLKAVVLEPSGALRVRVYRRSVRGPLEDAREILAALASELGPDIDPIDALGVTGYTADVLGPVLGADATPIETLAHARSARHYAPDADVVCDVGGQDIKVLVLGTQGVERFYLSNQCAAGNGVLLEATARDLGIEPERYAEVAFGARRAPQLSTGCAVFLDTERVTCQRAGFTPAEILAGFAAVLPRNIWENVVAAPSLKSLGRVFVLSGGVQRNAAAVKAQADYILARYPDARVVVHPHAGEAGAVGAALAAREERPSGRTRFVGVSKALAARFTSHNDESTRCRACPSGCSRAVVEASTDTRGTVRIVTGFACDRGATLERPRDLKGPSPAAGVRRARNLLRVEAFRLFRSSGSTNVVSRAGRGLRIAIPRVLSMYRSAPFFIHYLEAIGVASANIVVGDVTTY